MYIIMPVEIDETKKQMRSKSVDVSQVIRNVTGVEQTREKKSVLSQLLEPKQVEDGEKDRKKALEIAKKIARGASVSPEEKKFLMEVDPNLAEMAEMARQEGERIKHALSQASTKEEQQNIVQQMVLQVSKTNEQFGMLLGEAVKEAVQEKQKKAPSQTELGNDKSQAQPDKTQEGNVLPMEQNFSGKDSQQVLLEQFFKDEWMSMLDCRG